MIDVTLEEAGPCRKLLKIRVPKDDIQAKLDESYDTLRKSAAVDGFRKSHVPRKLLEKRFGEQVIQDLRQSIMAEASQEAIEREKLDLLGDPSFDSADFKTDEDFSFTVTVEVRPQFEIEDYKGLQLKRPAAKVTDDEVETGIRNVLRRIAKWNPIAAGEVQEDDRLACALEIKVGEEAVVNDASHLVEARSGTFAGLGIADFVAQIKGAKVGETRAFNARFPDDYANEKLRDKEGALSLTIKEIRRASIPELNDEVAKTMDFKDAEQFREEVGRQLLAGKQRAANESLETQIQEQLQQKVAFDLPDGLLKRQAREYMRRQQLHLRMRGMPDEEIQNQLDNLRAASEEAAARNFKTYFILEKIAEKEKIFVTEDETQNMIAALANRYNTTPHKLEQEMEEQDSLASLRAEMRHDKVIKLLLDEAKIEDEA